MFQRKKQLAGRTNLSVKHLTYVFICFRQFSKHISVEISILLIDTFQWEQQASYRRMWITRAVRLVADTIIDFKKFCFILFCQPVVLAAHETWDYETRWSLLRMWLRLSAANRYSNFHNATEVFQLEMSCEAKPCLHLPPVVIFSAYVFEMLMSHSTCN